MDLPALTADQMHEVDRIMVEKLHIDLIQMMENAGRNLAELALRRFGPGSVVVLAGAGGNGGGGLVAARHLANRGVAVSVALAAAPAGMAGVPRHQLDIVDRMGIPVRGEPFEADLVLDALIGYSLRGDPHGRTAELIRWSLGQPSPVCALDAPSGLDVTTGEPMTPCVRATVTLTLGLPKVGLRKAPENVGELYLADISVPPSVYARIGVPVPDGLFAADVILRLS